MSETVSVVSCAIFGAISGSAAATLSCIGSMMEPRLTEAGYPKGHTAALLAAACPLGLLIPPSTAQILYAWSSAQSVLACFLATIVPGILLALQKYNNGIDIAIEYTDLVKKMMEDMSGGMDEESAKKQMMGDVDLAKLNLREEDILRMIRESKGKKGS